MASSPTDGIGIHFVVSTAFAIWIIVDSHKRKKLAWAHAIISFFLMWWICLPFYIAGRPLKPGETREGGYAWNVCKFFMLGWTLLLAYCLLIGMVNVSNSLSNRDMGNAYASAGAALGVGVGLGFFFCLYVGVAIPVIITGLLLKKNLTETGASAAGYTPPVQATPIQTANTSSGATVGESVSISVARNGQNIGTFDVNTFKQHVASGLILPTDHYWIKGMAAWALVSTYRY
jgi:hypothetical protein